MLLDEGGLMSAIKEVVARGVAGLGSLAHEYDCKKVDCSVWTLRWRKVIWTERESACAAEMRAHKYGFGGVSEQLNYILPPPNGLSSPPVEVASNLVLQCVTGARQRGELVGESRSLVKDFCFMLNLRRATCGPPRLWNPITAAEHDYYFFW